MGSASSLRAANDTAGGERQELSGAWLQLPSEREVLRGLQVELVSARQSLLQTEATGRFEHLHVQAGEVSPIPRSQFTSIGADMQHSEALGARDGEGQKSAAYGAGDPGADCSTSTTRAGQVNAVPDAADLLQRNRRRFRYRGQRRQPFHQLGQRVVSLESIAVRSAEQQRATRRGHRAGPRLGLHARLEIDAPLRGRYPEEYDGAGTATPATPTSSSTAATTAATLAACQR